MSPGPVQTEGAMLIDKDVPMRTRDVPTFIVPTLPAATR